MAIALRVLIYVLLVAVSLSVYLLLKGRRMGRGRLFAALVSLLLLGSLFASLQIYYARPAVVKRYTPFLVLPRLTKFKRLFSEMEVWIHPMDGSGDINLLPKDYITTRDIQWSPDGTQIVCARVRRTSEGMHLFVYSADGSAPRRVTSGTGIFRRPSWSPDGRFLACDFGVGVGTATEIRVLGADGQGMRRLADVEWGEAAIPAGPSGGHGLPGVGGPAQSGAANPVWSADGKILFFLSRRGKEADIWAMNSEDGGGLRRLTDSPKLYEAELACSRDGRTLAYSAGRRAIYLLDTTGGQPRLLVDLDRCGIDGQDPSWSADGTWIFFTGLRPGERGRMVCRIRPDGSGMETIIGLQGRLFTPVLSPDGTRLAYLKFLRNVMVSEPPTGLVGEL